MKRRGAILFGICTTIETGWVQILDFFCFLIPDLVPQTARNLRSLEALLVALVFFVHIDGVTILFLLMLVMPRAPHRSSRRT